MSTRVALAAVLIAMLISRPSGGQERTVRGAESDKLLDGIAGYVLIDRSSREITLIHLPSLKETIIRPSPGADPEDAATIHALSGPDSEGRIAYIEDHFFVAQEKDRRHLLKTIKLDGTEDTELFSRPGDAMWSHRGEIGRTLALAPVGGRVAFLSALRGVQMPGAYLQEGSMEIWDISKKTGGKTDITALDQGLAWFPDGRRLAYVKLVENKGVRGSDGEDDSFGNSLRSWQKVPVVFVRDIDAATESILHLGTQPVVSPNGESVIVRDFQGACKLVNVANSKSTTVSWPGIPWAGIIAMPAPEIVLAWCLPTEGTKVKYTENNSPLVGPKQMLTLKLIPLNSDEFQTIVPYVDPRQRVSFGQYSR